MISKSALRKVILDYRRLMSEDEYVKRNKVLLRKLSNLIELRSPRSIHVFLPIERNKEPNVRPLLRQLSASGRQVIVSKTDFKTRKMEHFYYEREMHFEEDKLGIPQPVDGKRASVEEADLILVPLVVADKANHRIGYGGGFYDELLNQTKAYKLGLSLSSRLDYLIQREDWDISLDEVLTGVH